MKGMFFIYSGKVKVHKKWDDEKELIVRFAGKGDIVGHRGLGNDIYYPVLESITSRKIVGVTNPVFFLDLRATVHHAPNQTSLLLHSQFDYSFLEELVAESGLDVELIREPDE